MRGAQPPEAIVLDLMMPRLDGTGFVELMRLNPRLASVPIVILSADPAMAEAAQALGARGALAKPFHMDVLLAMVDQVSQT
jgi:two-component system chemotaxis response regulator CheY